LTVLEIDTNLATKKSSNNQISLYQSMEKAQVSNGIVFAGYIKVNQNRHFEFRFTAMMEANFYIDDELIVDNDGDHARYERSAGVALKAGFHAN
jgi:hexosaminidase